MIETQKPHAALAQFERNAALQRPAISAEMFHYLMRNKKWWLIPVVLMLMILGVLVVLGGTAVAPFVYTLF